MGVTVDLREGADAARFCMPAQQVLRSNLTSNPQDSCTGRVEWPTGFGVPIELFERVAKDQDLTRCLRALSSTVTRMPWMSSRLKGHGLPAKARYAEVAVKVTAKLMQSPL